MGQKLWLITIFLACSAAGAMAEDRPSKDTFGTAHSHEKSTSEASKRNTGPRPAAPLDRIVIAVDGAESSHGQNPAMWRSDPSGPQGPMQVSEAAATDVGGGDRFDIEQNRALGRAYLVLLYQRYGNWPDAIAAYNWGIGRMDAWLKAGRPPDQLDGGVAVYMRRVLNDSGLCAETAQVHPPLTGGRPPRRSLSGSVPPDELISTACSAGDVWPGPAVPSLAPSRFVKKLEQALQLAASRAARGP